MSIKDKLTEDLDQAKEVGKLRSDRIREIITAAFSQLQAEIKEGSGDLRPLAKDAFAAVIATLQSTGSDAKEQVSASIEGIVDGISSARRKTIADTEAQMKQLEADLEAQEQQLEQEVATGLAGVREASQEAPASLRQQIEETIAGLQDNEEVAMLKQRYAKLQAQLAVLKANLAARAGDYYDKAQVHLDEAKVWYDKARPQAESMKEQADQKVTEFEQKLAEAGTSLAQREKQVRQKLAALLHHAAEALKDDRSKPIGTLPPHDDTQPKP
jgi:myosin heavy subunit